MTIIYKLDAAGGFTVGDSETRHTAYAYPTSPYAYDARRHPGRIAQDMVLSANAFARVAPSQIVIESDARNWARLREMEPNVVSLMAAGD